MCIRAYLVLLTEGDTSPSIISELRRKPGIVAVDILEGSPNLILVIQAEKRQELVGYIEQALDSVESKIKDLRFFIGRENHVPILTPVIA
jgi:hypothetical protein